MALIVIWLQHEQSRREFEGKIGHLISFRTCRSDARIDQPATMLRMLPRRRSANRAGVRSHGVKRGNW